MWRHKIGATTVPSERTWPMAELLALLTGLLSTVTGLLDGVLANLPA
ncbi:hypothetical protein [Zhihengliuella salsuginis]|uniref:Uncharacterized protein n=1 Tax=Zhihengliuella salsuginis TaxID=578222 RepID=A0ABQ3GKA3_9MICC|nr:hypothetical protein [Zhihengliuella salsuginis]GHD10068.1 hypothetical protein GCM10008096_23210 [Zhihengliuella salsuginis]